MLKLHIKEDMPNIHAFRPHKCHKEKIYTDTISYLQYASGRAISQISFLRKSAPTRGILQVEKIVSVYVIL